VEEFKVAANALQLSALTCFEHEVAPWCPKEDKNIGLECFTLLLFFFFLIRRNMGIGNDITCLSCFTSCSPISTENRQLQQQIYNFKFIEVHVALKASLSQMIHMCFLKN